MASSVVVTLHFIYPALVVVICMLFYKEKINDYEELNSALIDILFSNYTNDTDLPTDAAGDSIWLPQIDTTSTYVDYETISPMIDKLKTKSAFDGRGTVLDYAVSDVSVLSKFKVDQQAQQRFTPAKDLMAGFQGVIIDGVTWYADDHVQNASSTAKTLYLVASNSIKLLYKYGFGGENSPLDVDKLRIPNQPLLSNQKMHAGNFFMVNRRVNGVFKALNPNATRS